MFGFQNKIPKKFLKNQKFKSEMKMFIYIYMSIKQI